MFTDFFYFLRAHGLKVSLTEWLSLMKAITQGHSRADLAAFYNLARSLLVKRETEFDLYDRCFASFFKGIDGHFDLDEELLKWLEDPKLAEISEEQRAMLKELDLDELREEFKKRLRDQKERHDGGSQWIGTGGTSPFGHGGENPAGVRVGGEGGARTAVQIATERRFKNLSGDRILDTRQIGVALRRLKRLAKDEGPEELDIEATVDESARNGGEIDLVFAPPKRNRVKLLLLMDVGGSMDPHSLLCERLFSAAHAANHFKEFEHRFFHNCVYEYLYTDIARWQGDSTAEMLKNLDSTWSVVFVGDAWMAPYELMSMGGAIDFYYNNSEPGIAWLQRFRERCPNSLWLNPEPRRFWSAPTIEAIHRIFPMFELTLDDLSEAIDVLRGVRPNRPAAA